MRGIVERGASDGLVLSPLRWAVAAGTGLGALLFLALLAASALTLEVRDPAVALLMGCHLTMMALLWWLTIVMVRGKRDALTAEGVRFRTSVLTYRATTLGWSKIAALRYLAVGGSRFLGVVPADPAGYLGGLGAAQRRTAESLDSRYGVPILVWLHPSVTADQIRGTVAELGGEALAKTLGRRPTGPRPSGGRRPGRPRVSRTTGLLALALSLAVASTIVVSRAWELSWWPGVEEATQLPDPCAVATGLEPVTSLVGEVEPAPGEYDDGLGTAMTSCQFTGADASLTVTYLRYAYQRGGRAADRAHTAYDLTVDGHLTQFPVRMDLGDLGDEAVIGVQTGDSSTTFLMARRANVLVEIEYTGTTAPEATSELITEVASEAIAAITLR